MKKIIWVISFLIIQSCTRNYECIRPYTKNEIKFIDSLETNGKKVSISRFNYKSPEERLKACGWNTTYSVNISNEKYGVIKNLDSMRLKSRSIAVELFNNVIEDSLLVFIPKIKIFITSKSSQKYKAFGNIYEAEFKKEDLEKFCGFRVKALYNREFNDVYRRERISPKSDNLRIDKENFI